MVKCFFGLHHYEVYKEEKLQDLRGNVIGNVIVSRCSDCGKLTSKEVLTAKAYLNA